MAFAWMSCRVARFGRNPRRRSSDVTVEAGGSLMGCGDAATNACVRRAFERDAMNPCSRDGLLTFYEYTRTMAGGESNRLRRSAPHLGTGREGGRGHSCRIRRADGRSSGRRVRDCEKSPSRSA
eukprot:2578249-Prymnesium_polylepis.1